jgi:hypothetical protein
MRLLFLTINAANPTKVLNSSNSAVYGNFDSYAKKCSKKIIFYFTLSALIRVHFYPTMLN